MRRGSKRIDGLRLMNKKLVMCMTHIFSAFEFHKLIDDVSIEKDI